MMQAGSAGADSFEFQFADSTTVFSNCGIYFEFPQKYGEMQALGRTGVPLGLQLIGAIGVRACVLHMSLVNVYCLWLFIMFAQCHASTPVFEICHQHTVTAEQ